MKSQKKQRMGLVAAGAVALAMCFAATTANATAITASVGGVPTGADCYESFNSLPLGSAGGVTTDCGISVSFKPDGQAVQGASSGVYAPPFLSNNNGALFGDPNNGADGTIYLAAGSTGTHSDAGVTLGFAGPQRYFGLLWGSVDNFNTLTFFQGGTEIAHFTGSDVGNAAGAGNCIGGNQEAQGTCYVNINLSDWFDRVVATSSEHTFEFDNVAFAANPLGVPEPGTPALFLLGLALLGSGYWLRKRAAA